LPQRWVLQLAIEGELRFLSHLDCVRAIERTFARGKLPLRFTQGFNPHPVMSLVCPKPVGVSTKDDLLILSMDEPVQEEELLRRLNAHGPSGMRFNQARLLPDRRTPRPLRMTYFLEVDEAKRQRIAERLEQLTVMESWPVERIKPARGKSRSRKRVIDLKVLIESVKLDGMTLCWITKPQGDLWARVDEVLRLVSLEEPCEVASVVRKKVTTNDK